MVEQTKQQFNRLCSRCIRQCKQDLTIQMLECPRFQPRPFKSEQCCFQQLDLFGDPQD